MTQETGETRDAIIEDDNKRIEEIVAANKDLRDPYWIVVFAKPSKVAVDGKPTLMKHIKAYKTNPPPQVGQIVGEVDNSKGTIKWEVNMPQRPFDFDALQGIGAESCDDVVVETTSIPGAYITK
jgi:hypothetical protein